MSLTKILDILFVLALVFFVLRGSFNASDLIILLAICAALAAIQMVLLKGQTKPNTKLIFYVSVFMIALILITILAIVIYTAKTILL